MRPLKIVARFLILGLVASLAPASPLHAADAKPDRDVEEDGVGNRAIQLAMLETYQQPLSGADSAAPPNAARTARYSSRTLASRLARGPNMFGDAQMVFRGIDANGTNGNDSLGFIAALGSSAAGSRKMAENDKVLPMDRVFFNYNHFANGQTTLTARTLPGIPAPTLRSDVNRYTLGGEKTFFDGYWSFEGRIAMASSIEANAFDAQYDGGVPSNVTMFLKNLFYDDEVLALGGGLGVSLPNASDVIVTDPINTMRFREHTTHLMPYVGFFAMPTDDWFLQGFAQVDFASGSDNLDAIVPGQGTRTIASIGQQHLLFLDVAVGRWLYVDEEARYVTGIAGVVELHYLSTLNDTETSVATVNIGNPLRIGTASYALTNLANRVDVVNLTAGVQFQLGDLTNLRIGAVAPLSTGLNRLFDSELQLSLNRNF